MEAKIKVNHRDLIDRQTSNRFEEGMNAVVAHFIADLISARGAGDYKVLLRRESYPAGDYIRFHITARLSDGSPVDVPYPNWERIPANYNWWTVDYDGGVTWHERKPEAHQTKTRWLGWISEGAMGGPMDSSGTVSIPLGIDWRTLCFQRPEHLLATYDAVEEPPHAERKADPDATGRGPGWLSSLRKFLP